MKKKIYILALTFFCLLCSQASFGQNLNEGIDGSTPPFPGFPPPPPPPTPPIPPLPPIPIPPPPPPPPPTAPPIPTPPPPPAPAPAPSPSGSGGTSTGTGTGTGTGSTSTGTWGTSTGTGGTSTGTWGTSTGTGGTSTGTGGYPTGTGGYPTGTGGYPTGGGGGSTPPPEPKNWFLDNDGDKWYDSKAPIINAVNKPAGNYMDTPLGVDCDDSPTGGNVHQLNKCGKCEVEPVSNKIACTGVIVNCKCVIMKDWYVDRDKDGFESTSEKAELSPGGEYIEGISKGKDCDDTVWSADNLNCNLKKTWYLDNDNDVWHSQAKQAETSPGTKWKETTTGIDCNDARNSLTNDCSKADPCAEIKNILDYEAPDPNTKDLKPNINRLEDVVEAAVNDKEEGFEISKRMNADETYRYEFDTAKTGLEFEINLATSASYVGAFHSHPSTGVPMYSFQDLKFLLGLYNDAKNQYKQDVFSGLVAKDAKGNTNVYILKVDDIAKLQKLVTDTWDNPDYAKYTTDKERRDAIHRVQAREYAKESDKEKSFLEQFSATGISVFKADATINNFSKLTLDKEQVTKTPCN